MIKCVVIILQVEFELFITSSVATPVTDCFHSRDQLLHYHCFVAILVHLSGDKLIASFTWNLVLWLIVGCGRKSRRDKGLYFARVPSLVTNQGKEAQELCEERTLQWISVMSHDNLSEEILENDCVCEKHFVLGRVAMSWDKYNID